VCSFRYYLACPLLLNCTGCCFSRGPRVRYSSGPRPKVVEVAVSAWWVKATGNASGINSDAPCADGLARAEDQKRLRSQKSTRKVGRDHRNGPIGWRCQAN